MKPPNIVLLTPNGRFEVHRKICLSISGYHPESWRPSWSIRTTLLALIGFMPTCGVGAIGSLNQPKEERQLLARKSQSYVCSICGPTNNLLLPLTTASSSMNEEANEAAAQISMMSEEEFRNKKALANSNTFPPPPPTTTTTIANNNDHQTDSISGITSQSNLSSGNLINPSSTPSTSIHTTPFSMPSLSSPIQSNTTNITENMNSHLWTGFPSYVYPYRNENITPQIAYWLCFPVYYPVPPFPMNANSSSSLATAVSSTIDSGTASGERIPLSFGEWLKGIREKEKSASTSVHDTVSSSPSSTTNTDATQVTHVSHSNENTKPTTSKTLTAANESKQVVDSSENQVHAMGRTISAQNKNESRSKEKSSSSLTDKPPEYVQNSDSLKKKNLNEHEVPLVGTSSKTGGNSNTMETNESCKDNSISKLNKTETNQIQTDTHGTDGLHNRIIGRSVSTPNPNDNNRTPSGHIRRSTSLVQYHTATVCAVGVAIALFIIVMRRLAIMFQEI
ncbi:unnamed protein product [Schistosoma rodhaini]|nr:unnamed protein product [Schistosoma rodhaini]